MSSAGDHDRLGSALKRLSARWARGKWFFGAVALSMCALVLASGAGGWWLANRTLVASHANAPAEGASQVEEVSDVQMPDVRGLDQASAVQVLADSGIAVDDIVFREVPSVVQPGVVVEQEPSFGSPDVADIELGMAVEARMPDMGGVSQDDAIADLSRLGTSVTISYAYSGEVAAGTVVTSKPAPGRRLRERAELVVATAGTTLALLDLSPLTGDCDYREDVAVEGQDYPVALACRTSEPGDDDATWLLSKGADRFTATIGIADDRLEAVEVPFQVVLDGIVVASGVARRGQPALVDVASVGAVQLALRLEPVAPGGGDAELVLADALLYGAEDSIERLAGLR